MTAAATRQNISSSQHSKTTTSLAGTANSSTSGLYCMIPASYAIFVGGINTTAIVLRSFIVAIQSGSEDYTVTSNISSSYELGETPGQAIKNYLEILVEELVWLEKNKADLSSSVFDDFYRLKNYIRIV